MAEKENIRLILLAAGSSSRLGRRKQLLKYHGELLINHCIEIMSQTGYPVSVVLGAYADEIQAHFKEPVDLIVNQEWELGMSTSVKKAVYTWENQAHALLFCAVDQPLITTDHLNRLITMYREGTKAMVATAYNNILGVPAIISHPYYEKLKSLEGDKGARKILSKYTDDVNSIEFSGGHIDIDTEDDIKRLKNLE